MRQLIPAMIEAGLDGAARRAALLPRHGPAPLKAAIRRAGPLQRRDRLPPRPHRRARPASVREKTREVLEIMKPGGGYVAGASHDTILEETPVENVLAMFDVPRDYIDR